MGSEWDLSGSAGNVSPRKGHRCTYGRKALHLWARSVAPMGAKRCTYGREALHLWATAVDAPSGTGRDHLDNALGLHALDVCDGPFAIASFGARVVTAGGE